MAHLQKNKQLLNRIKRMQGQLTAIETAVSNGDVPCIDILQQVSAVKGAVTGLMNELVEEQLVSHVLPQDYNQEELDKFLKILKKYG